MTTIQEIDFVLIPKFSMFALMATLEPLRVANRFGGELYRWRLVGLTQDAVPASNHISLMPECSFKDIRTSKYVIVCASFEPKRYLCPQFRAWLRRMNDIGAVLGSLDTGLYFLSDAGLVGHEAVTLHWEQIPCYREDYPDVEVTDELFEIGPRRVYCAGGAAGMDMMLHKIAKDHGAALALSVSEQFLVSRIRGQEEHQRSQIALRYGIHSKRLTTALLLMEQHIEEPLKIDEIAERAHVSRRQLERLFKTCIGETPNAFSLKLRLDRAHALLRETSLSITEISVATGFNSVSYFSRAFRQRHGRQPASVRNKAASDVL